MFGCCRTCSLYFRSKPRLSPKLLYVGAVVVIVIPSFLAVVVERDVAGRERLPVIFISVVGAVVTIGRKVDDNIGGGSECRVKGVYGAENGVSVTRFWRDVEARWLTSEVGAIAVKRWSLSSKNEGCMVAVVVIRGDTI